MDLITEDDPRYFTCTSLEPYDRQHYKIINKDGKELVVDNYMHAQMIWFQSDCGRYIDRIEVIDK